MLKIDIPDKELFDEKTETFFILKGESLVLEHSLVSLSKWESKWRKPFISKDKKTKEETLDYIQCMTITQNVNPDIYKFISSDIISQVNEYIEHPMTATTFSRNENEAISREIITAEIIYYWMVTFNIPFECQKWHLNRLLTLINVCAIKNKPKKKISRQALMNRNTALNAARRQQLNSNG